MKDVLGFVENHQNATFRLAFILTFMRNHDDAVISRLIARVAEKSNVTDNNIPFHQFALSYIQQVF